MQWCSPPLSVQAEFWCILTSITIGMWHRFFHQSHKIVKCNTESCRGGKKAFYLLLVLCQPGAGTGHHWYCCSPREMNVKREATFCDWWCRPPSSSFNAWKECQTNAERGTGAARRIHPILSKQQRRHWKQISPTPVSKQALCLEISSAGLFRSCGFADVACPWWTSHGSKPDLANF